MTTIQFNHQLEKIESLLFGFALRLTRNKENAKDLMQETLMRCFDKRDRFQVGTNFKSWSTTVMYNSFINQYRKRKTRNRVLKPVKDFNYVVENKCTDGNAESVIMLKELNNIMNALSGKYQIPFTMLVNGYRYNEIAKELNLPLGTVKSRIFYARKKLKISVKNKYGITSYVA